VWAWAAAAVLALAVSGVYLLRDPGRTLGEPPVLRGDGASFAVTATMGDRGLTLAWPAVDGAAQYGVRLFDAEGRLLWERRTPDARLAVSRSELPAATGTGPLFVEVEALDALLQPVARSPVASVVTETPSP
jgi:hypothetical protein